MKYFAIRFKGKQVVIALYQAEKLIKEVTMEELQKTLIAEIGKQLETDKKNVQLLDVLNRLLGTVSTNLLAKDSKGK
jgi:hypothetical protein